MTGPAKLNSHQRKGDSIILKQTGSKTICCLRFLVAGASLWLLMFASPVLSAETAVKIDNTLYAVDVDAAGGTFAVLSKLSGKTFLSGGKLSGTGGTARIVAISHDVFGSGKVIEITYPDGNRESVALYSGTPFVHFQTTLHNGRQEPVVLNHVPTVSAIVELSKPAAEVATLGTGGLLAPAKNPGSYAFLALVDPQTRSGVVSGWLSHDRGSGVVFSPVQENTVRVQAQIDYGQLRIKPGEDAAAETFAIGYFKDARFGLEAYADAIAKIYSIKLPLHRPGYCTWYMEKHGGACDEQFLRELSNYAAKNLKPFGFDFIQIDDGWQEGILVRSPKKNFTTHAPRGPFPSGMKAAADNIRNLNLTPGIWFMPFAGTSTDPYFKDHQDWFAKGPDGKPFETDFGGTCLDMTQPGAREHVRSVVQRISHDWGYRVFKLDAFWTGSATRLVYPNNGYRDDAIGEARFSNADVTNIEALRSGVKLVRETAGPEVFLLGCCVSQNMRSFGGSFGLLDAMRVGPDSGAGRIGAPHASRLWFLNGRVWWNDPDCVSVRVATSLAQARLNASFTAIADDLFYNSDWMPDLPPERLDILRRCMPPHHLASRPVDVFQNEPARIWHLADTRQMRRRDVVALYNWRLVPTSISETAERIGLPPAQEYVGFDFWANRFIPPFRETLRADLPAGNGCRILAVQPVLDHPQLLSTSRHVTQGMVDVVAETWDAAKATLSASSKVVANDPYELRIVVPMSEKSWIAAGASVSADDQAAGVKTTIQQDGPKLRVVVTSPVSRDVQWQVQFAPASIRPSEPQPVTNLKSTVEYWQISLNWDDRGADFYRITRSDGFITTSPSASYVDSSFVRGQAYRYSVAAVGWDGKASAPVTIAATSMAELKPPPTPPLPDVYLDALSLNVMQNESRKAGINKSVLGKTLSIENKQYEKGLGVHANSTVVCPIPLGASRFVAVVGLDDAKRDDERSSVQFKVYGEVKEMGQQPVLLGESPVLSSKTIRWWNFNAELNDRYRELRLVISAGDDGSATDQADWVNAGFVISKDR